MLIRFIRCRITSCHFPRISQEAPSLVRCYSGNLPEAEISRYEILRRKIIYNTVLTSSDGSHLTYFAKRRIKYRKMRTEFATDGQMSSSDDSISLKYLDDTPNTPPPIPKAASTPVQFPFDLISKKQGTYSYSKNDNESTEQLDWLNSPDEFLKKLVIDKHWLPHNQNDDSVAVDGENVSIKYGTTDPTMPISEVACGGCGALLHCQETSIPGFVPKELFEGLNNSELKTLVCQRCHFLKDYNIALSVDVSSDDYPKILSHVKGKKALVILMVDLLDMPCSIWAGITDLIGLNTPIVVVANKIDLIMQDSPGFFQNVTDSLMDSLMQSGIPADNIKHIELISAKTGFGVESLITEIHASWRYQGDIYIIGCTNVGKSTLFNTLIQSDMCKVQAVDLMQRATVSEWPGTTLNLLRFPILRPSHWRVQARRQRLFTLQNKAIEESLGDNRMKKSRYRKQSSLKGDVGRTFAPESPMAFMADPFAVAISNNPRGTSPLGLDPNHRVYAESKWCYDTPGVVHPDQALNLLTTPEIMDTIPKSLIVPRPLHLQPGHSVLIAGLARIDYLKGPDFAWFTVFAADKLPLTVTKTEDVEEVYRELLGSELLQVPLGESSRLEKWPELASKELQISGKNKNEAASDIVLSSAGWVTITLEPAEFCQVEAWTPGGRGIHLRLPFVKKAHLFRAAKIKDTPVFRSRMKVMPD